jgi:hypothetical protein
MLVIILLVLLQPILVAAKINQSLKEDGALESTSWFAIFVPCTLCFVSRVDDLCQGLVCVRFFHPL